MAAFNYTQPADATGEQDTYANRTYAQSAPPNSSIYDVGVAYKIPLGLGPIPYVTRYSEAGSVAFIYVQTDRVLVTSGALTTAANYTLVNVASPPTVTTVTFTTGKSYIRLTLSGIIDHTKFYSLQIAQNTFSDVTGVPFNIATAIPLVVDINSVGVGIEQDIAVNTPWMNTAVMPGFDETIAIGTPVMSHT